MFTIRRLSLLVAALGLSACVSANDPASRNAGPASSVPGAMSQSVGSPEAGAPVYLAASFDVEAVRVTVPPTLKVSEANTFKPKADIVWRGEALGDRYAQVAAIFEEAMSKGTANLHSGRKVDLDIEVTRFHALTEKTRYTFGGMHEMRFLLTVRDAATGQVLQGPREVVADTKASGGAAAIAEDQAGRTQRVVTVERLAEVIRRELSAPASQEMIVARMQTETAPLAE